jgi:hypothetical protein
MWPRLVNVALGIWLIAAPAVLGYAAPAATNDRIVGPLIATFACVAIWQATRSLRWLNVPLGLWLMLAPLVLGYPRGAAVNSILIGIGVTVVAFVRGRLVHRFGGGWPATWKPLLARNTDSPRT